MKIVRLKKQESKHSIEVIGNIPTPYGYKKKIIPGMYFAAALIRKDNVSFYYFCSYMNPEDFKSIAPTVMKCLDGKSCFHFKKEEQVVEKELRAMFKKGIELYRKQGFMK